MNSSTRRTLSTATVAIAIAVVSPLAPAAASPEDPCEGGVAILICHLLPIAPDLDHDIDLTQPAPAGPPNASAAAPNE